MRFFPLITKVLHLATHINYQKKKLSKLETLTGCQRQRTSIHCPFLCSSFLQVYQNWNLMYTQIKIKVVHKPNIDLSTTTIDLKGK